MICLSSHVLFCRPAQMAAIFDLIDPYFLRVSCDEMRYVFSFVEFGCLAVVFHYVLFGGHN